MVTSRCRPRVRGANQQECKVVTKEKAVDPVMLARCFGLYARVVTGATKYLRDESDTFSPMMDRLRQDHCRAENVIDAFLAVQRFLGLQQESESLFDYCDRVLFMAIIQEKHAELGTIEMLSFARDPRQDKQSAAWFKALASDRFKWLRGDPSDLGTMFRQLDAVAKEYWDDGKADPLGAIDFAPDTAYEEVDEDLMAFYAPDGDGPKVVH